MIITCPCCFSADDVSFTKAPEAGFLYTCRNVRRHDPVGEWRWIADPEDPTSAEWIGADGVTSDLMDPLEQILRRLPAMWFEYGVLEYELRTGYPELFGRHVADRGHGIIAPTRATASSSRFAIALVRLERAGIVRERVGPATGAWRYLTTVSHWALEPVTTGAPTMSWEQRATDLGRNPDWTDDDRDAVRQLAAEYRS